jgi:hypothetical protein
VTLARAASGWRTLRIKGSKVLWGMRPCAGTARPPGMRIFAFAHSRLYFVLAHTQRRRAMWRMSNAQALIFVAAVVVIVALLLLA